MPNASHSVQPTARIVLHIGAMKTGTTFLQQLLAEHREALGERGVAVPRDQALAMRGVLHGTPAEDAPSRRDRVAHRFLREVGAYDATTVLSWEFLSFLDRPSVDRLLAALPHEATVVLAVRDAARTMPAQWQTTCRNGSTLPWPRFGRAVGVWLDDGRDSRAARVFRRTQDAGAMLATWVGAVGADRVRVVTVPRSGGDPLRLWHRFAEAGGLPAEVPVTAPARSNPSLGHASCELLRRVNVVLEQEGDLPEGAARVIRAVVAPDLEARSGSEVPVRLDPRGQEVAAAWNRRTRAAIEAAAVPVVGDLDDLPVTPPDDLPAVHRPDDAELVAAARTARAGLLGLGVAAPGEAPADVEEAVRELASLVRAASGLDLAAARRARGRGRS